MCHHLGFICRVLDWLERLIRFDYGKQWSIFVIWIRPPHSILVLNPAIYHHVLLTSRWDTDETKFNPFMMKWFPLTSTLIVSMKENMSNNSGLRDNFLRNMLKIVLYFDFQFLCPYKRPQDSYACPDQSKGNRTNQSTCLRGKNILKWCNYTGKSKMYLYSFSFLAQKALFLPPF